MLFGKLLAGVYEAANPGALFKFLSADRFTSQSNEIKDGKC